jgi:hypothetical protein
MINRDLQFVNTTLNSLMETSLLYQFSLKRNRMKGKQYYFVLVHQFLSILISISENTFTGFAGFQNGIVYKTIIYFYQEDKTWMLRVTL